MKINKIVQQQNQLFDRPALHCCKNPSISDSGKNLTDVDLIMEFCRYVLFSANLLNFLKLFFFKMNMQIKDVIDLECMYVILLETNKANDFINKKIYISLCMFVYSSSILWVQYLATMVSDFMSRHRRLT